MTEKITQSMPEILQFFNANLLSTPCPKLFGDDSKTLFRIYNQLMLKLSKKCFTDELHTKYQKLQKEFMELYGRIQDKEKELSETEKNKRKWPYLYFRNSNRRRSTVLRRLNNKSHGII